MEITKINITSFEQLREYCAAFRLVMGHGIEDQPEEEDDEPEDADPEEDSESEAPRRRGKRTPNHKAAAQKYASWQPKEYGCLSGSGKDVPEGRKFASGGQHVLSSIAGAVNAGKLDFENICPRAYKYLLDSGKYPNIVDRLAQELDEA